jgi:hypothetical protein
MKNSIIVTLISLSIMMISLNSCVNQINLQNTPDPNKGYVAITVAMPQGLPAESTMVHVARTIFPGMDSIAKYELSFEGPESTASVTVNLGINNPIELAAGNWTVTATAFTGSAGSYTVIARGSAAIPVNPGETASASITLGPVTGGTGYFTYSITVPNGAAGSLVITSPEGAALSGGNISLATNPINSNTISLPSGQHLVQVSLSLNETQAGKTEILHVYPGMTSSIEYIFSENNFRFVTNLSDNTGVNDTIVVPGDIRWYQFTAASGTGYHVQWNDSGQGDSAKTGNIKVSAYNSDGSTIFTNIDSGWISPQLITGVSGTIYLKAQGYSGDSTGTYAIKYWSIVPDPAAPAVSAGLNMLTVQWAAVTGASAYEVWVGTSNDSGMAEKHGGDITGLTTEINGLENGTTYYVWVKAKNSVGTISGFSPNASGKPIADMGAVTVTSGSGQLTVTWAAIAGADEYEVYYGTGTVPEATAQTVNTTSATITDLTNGTSYNVWVKGKNANGTGGISAVASGKPLAPPEPPTIIAGNWQLTVSWAAAGGADEYEVYYGTGTPTTLWATVSGTTTTITGLVNESTYNVRIRGKNTSGVSAYSGTASGTITAPPGLYDEAINESGYLGSYSLADSITHLNSNAVTEHDYYILLGGDESANSIDLSFPDKSVGITLKGLGTERKINLNADTILFTAKTGVTLTLDDKITLVGRSTNSSSLVLVNDGVLVMKSGAKICGNANTNSGSSGGGVHVYIGTFTMDGGEISGNVANNSSDSSAKGGGVYVGYTGTFTMNGGEISGNVANVDSSNLPAFGGGVFSWGTFVMNGGEISGNTATSNSSFSDGGGVHSEGAFTMSGGTINGNTSSSTSSFSEGGGVYVRGSTFTMSGGIISGNTSSSTSSFSEGGGVYVRGSTFTMSGGEISGNTATSNSSFSDGGGVHSEGAFTMSGGTISGNTATATASSYGGGVYIGDSGTFTKAANTGCRIISNILSPASTNHGNQVDVYPGNKYRNADAGDTVALNSATSGSEGGWEE